MNWRKRANELKTDVRIAYLAIRDKRTPWYAKLLAMFVVGYALSPIDLIPDFIPVIGLVDDMILIPLGMILVLRLLPPQVLQECREKAMMPYAIPRKSWIAAGCILLLWTGSILWLVQKVI